MLKVSVRSFLTLAAVAVLLTAPNVTAQVPSSIDLYTSISSSAASAAEGELIDFTVTFGNNGPGVPGTGVFYVDIPKGYPMTQDNYDIFEASIGGTFTPVDGSAGLFTSFDCDGVMILVFGPDQDAAFFGAGNEQQVTFSMVMPELPMMAPGLAIDGYNDNVIFKAAGGNVTDGITCSDEGTYMGPRLVDVPAITAEIELVDDGTGANGDQGCNTLVGFTPGNIAWIDRGTCSFDVKVAVAQEAGASAVIIGNNAEDTNYADDAPISMGCGDYCGLLTIPSVGVSKNVNADVRALLAAGTVTGTIGYGETDHLTVFSTTYENGSGVDSNPANDDFYLEFAVTPATTGTAPTAAFTYAPAMVYVGDVVTFTDASIGDPMPNAFAWFFGDTVGASTEQNPTYTYTAAGTYTVTLTATNEHGSDEASMDVVVMDVVGPTGTNVYFAAAAALAGTGGSVWSTTVEVNNRGTFPMTYYIKWLDRNADNSDPTVMGPYTLGGGMGARYPNIVGDLFGGVNLGGGLAFMIDNVDDAVLTSRTFNTFDDGTLAGTFGQGIPAVKEADLIPENTKVRFIQLSQDDSARTNIGFLNGTAANLRIMAEFFLADGTSLGTDFIDLPPYSVNQWNNAFTKVTADMVADGFVDVWTETPGGMFTSYASVVGNDDFNDPTTILPQ